MRNHSQGDVGSGTAIHSPSPTKGKVVIFQALQPTWILELSCSVLGVGKSHGH